MAFAAIPGGRARGQALDLSQGGPVTVTSLGGIDWDQKAQTVTAHGHARAIRGNVTVDADRLIAFYRKKQAPPGTPPPAAPVAVAATTGTGTGPAGPVPATGGPDDTGNNEIYRLEAIGHVHIYTATDQAWGDQAIYDIDQSVLVLTGHALRLVTPSDTITARDSLEYWPQKRMSVARGHAVLVTADARRIDADVLVGFSAPNDAATRPAVATSPPANAAGTAGGPQPDALNSSGKLQKAEAYGDVVVRTATETVRGDRGVYVAASGIARILGNVHITRGQNQLDGQAAIVNMHTGLATLTNDPGERVQGLIVPENATPGAAPSSPHRAPGRGAS